LLKAMLVKAYPNKSPDDFRIQPRTLGIEFLDSGLDVDLVPVIPIEGPGDFGWQPSSQGKALLKTSIAGQLDFIRAYKDPYKNWTALVRLLKRWSKNHEIDELRSFTIELIICHLQATRGNPTSLDDGLSRFWHFIATRLGSTRVSFSKTQGGQGDEVAMAAPVIVVDPINAENNVAGRIDSKTLADIRGEAESAWALHHESRTARGKGDSLTSLRSIFGTDFDFE